MPPGDVLWVTPSRRIVSASKDKTIRMWDRGLGMCDAVLQGHAHGVTCLASRDNIIVSGSFDSTVKVWDEQVDVFSLVWDDTSRLSRCYTRLWGTKTPFLACTSPRTGSYTAARMTTPSASGQWRFGAEEEVS